MEKVDSTIPTIFLPGIQLAAIKPVATLIYYPGGMAAPATFACPYDQVAATIIQNLTQDWNKATLKALGIASKPDYSTLGALKKWVAKQVPGFVPGKNYFVTVNDLFDFMSKYFAGDKQAPLTFHRAD